MEHSGIPVRCNRSFGNFLSFSMHKPFPQLGLSHTQVFEYGTHIEIMLFR